MSDDDNGINKYEREHVRRINETSIVLVLLWLAFVLYSFAVKGGAL